MTLLFDGTDDRVETSATTGVPTTYPFAVCAVVRRSAQNAYHGIAQLGHGGSNTRRWAIELASDNTLEMSDCFNEAVNSTGTVPNTTWMFIGYSGASSTDHRLYCYNYESRSVVFNETKSTTVGIQPDTADSVKLGVFETSAGSYADFLNGRLAWIAVYDKDFTDLGGDAFLAIAHLGPYALARPTNLWPLWESTGTTAVDICGGLTGTLTSFPGSPWEPISLPGPWWSNVRAQSLRPQAAAPAGGQPMMKRLGGISYGGFRRGVF